MKTRTFRRLGLPALALASALFGSALTGIAIGAQGHMDAALRSLNTARTQLQTAVADKGGHRDRAISLVNQAITEVQAGIGYAATK